MTTDAVGGVWQYTLSLAAGLSTAGTRVTVVTLGPAPSRAQIRAATQSGAELVETGLPLDWTAPTQAAFTDAAGQVAQLAGRLGVDLAHVHAPALAASRWPVPVVAVAHSCAGTWWEAVQAGPIPQSLAWRVAQTRHGMHGAAATIAPSRAFARALHAAYGTVPRLAIVLNGRDGASRARPGRAGPVLCAGRLWDLGKNMRVLDRAARHITARVEAAGAAAGPDGVVFEPEHMALLGRLDDAGMERQRQRAGVFAAPSLYEPFGLAVLEAAASGLPLVLADIPVFRELWQGTAEFVSPQDVEGWAYAVNAMLADAPRRAVLGEAAAARAARYSRAAMVAGTRAVHRHAMAAARAMA